jgi:hypothetical protein
VARDTLESLEHLVQAWEGLKQERRQRRSTVGRRVLVRWGDQGGQGQSQ